MSGGDRLAIGKWKILERSDASDGSERAADRREMNQMAASCITLKPPPRWMETPVAASSAATKGATRMQTVVKTMDDIADSTQRELAPITSLINDIAHQTNIWR